MIYQKKLNYYQQKYFRGDNGLQNMFAYQPRLR